MGTFKQKKTNKLTCDRAGKITYISHNFKLIHNIPKHKTFISASSTTISQGQGLNDMPMTIDEDDYETDEDNSGEGSFEIPYADDESECESETEVEVEFLTYDDLKST